MKILVLGSEGLIGRPFVQYLINNNHEAIRWDKVNSREQDLSKPENTPKLISAINNSDVVVFLAFGAGGSKYLPTYDKTLAYIQENTLLMAHTFAALEMTHKPFLFVSSQMASMYHSNYGFLKNLGERYTKAIGGWICRFWNVYGSEDPQDPKSHVITDFVHMARTTNIIRMRTTGQEIRQFLHTDDCSRALLYWCENRSNFPQDEYIDITSFSWVTILEVAERIQNLIPCEIVTGTITDTHHRGAPIEPITTIQKYWQPLVSLDEGLQKIIESQGLQQF